MKYKCDKCLKEFHQKSNFDYHTSRKRPCIKEEIIVDDVNITNKVELSKVIIDIIQNYEKLSKKEDNIIINEINETIFNCLLCEKSFKYKSGLSKHKIKHGDYKEEVRKLKDKNIEKDNKIKQLLEENEINTELIEELKEENKKLKNKKEKYDNELDMNKKLNNIVNIMDQTGPINNQLINMIVDQKNTIKDLVEKKDIVIDEIIEEKIDEIIEPGSLILNNVVIISRTKDNYINATQLCHAGNKKFSHWISLDSTNDIIKELESDAGIPASQLIDSKKGNSSNFQQGSWIHPDLAIQLAQWISPKFALQVSKWIRSLFTNGKVEINIKLLKDKEKEIQTKDLRIQQLEDTYLKKHKRKDYPEKNVIYMLTTEDHKKNRTYIIGKAITLKNRLSSYNKTSDHEVIYYKSCSSEEDMHVIELMVLNKLREYKEVANRDRFVLPLEKDISFFTNIIEESIRFFSNNI
jgi:hypothetical protein